MRPKVLKDFCESTSLHGYSYLTADSVLSKVVWAIIILIATGVGLYCIAINTRDYMKASIVTNIESTSEKLHVSTQSKRTILTSIKAIGIRMYVVPIY